MNHNNHTDEPIDTFTTQRNEIFGKDTDPYTTITPLDKLIAVRQLCILFEKECFTRYKMELYSRLWEQNGKINIVFTAPRTLINNTNTPISKAKINKLKTKQIIVSPQQQSTKEKESVSNKQQTDTSTTTNISSHDDGMGGTGSTTGTGGGGGFIFIFHPNDTVTIQIPIDFHTEEFFMEFENNIWDVYNVVGYKNQNALEQILNPE